MSALPIASVRFSANAAALYFAPDGERLLARYLAIQLPRDGNAGEADLNVRYLRAIERAANNARANAESERAEMLEEAIEEGVAPCDGGITPGGCH